PFAIFDRQGQLLLAAGQSVHSQKQLDELAQKGLFHNPRWMSDTFVNPKARGTVKPETESKAAVKKPVVVDPSETGLSLKMSVEGSDDAFVVRLVGTLDKEAFIVSHPMRDKAFVFVKEGQIWEFRSFYGRSVYRFTAQVEKVLLSPIPLVIVSWPQETHVESKVIRAARRVSTVLPASLRRVRENDPGNTFLNGMIENLSTGGLEFSTSHPSVIQKGEQVQLAFQLNFGDRKFILEPTAQVMSVLSAADQSLYKYGLAFLDLSDQNFASIHAYVSDRLIQRIESPLYSREAP
ncbi:MAG TPA: flagellar brake protein, partial [Limnobacter sp.]|uniref:flagellar brake protein n=1 Tax=Limnobacter sp. TaxID=2003368 RepID=UPI002E32DFDD